MEIYIDENDIISQIEDEELYRIMKDRGYQVSKEPESIPKEWKSLKEEVIEAFNKNDTTHFSVLMDRIK